ncbi:translocator protein isoform X1 [Fasciola gigantica]|uniref:Translocator protein isoform X1 n=1 Tax=Fasciola gigantica TaxID=46835 RepID=A0A504YNW6_FASGI|nr:translocator protein isoform X1 [Fasciola gigantica]
MRGISLLTRKLTVLKVIKKTTNTNYSFQAPLLDARAVPFVVFPFLGSFYSRRVVDRNMIWYDSLKRPSFAPPKWIFPPVWSALYASMGLASYLVWRDASPDEVALPLACYGSQLLLNWSWTSVFFGAHKFKASVMVILGSLGGAIGCFFLFRPINELASNLLIPYIAWLGFASVVNIRTVMLNSDATKLD